MRIRRIASAALVVALAAALTGCGSNDKRTASEESAQPKAGVLSANQVQSALITLDDLGAGFKVRDNDTGDDSDDGGFGCMKFNSAAKITSDRKAEGGYQPDTEIGAPLVFSKIGSFADEDDAAKVLDNLRAAVADCHSVDDTRGDSGLRLQLAVELNDKTSGAKATEQVNLIGTGTGTIQGLTFPVGIRMTLIRIDNNIAGVAYVGMGKKAGSEAQALIDLAFDRLVAATAGTDIDPEPLNLDPVTEQDLVGAAAA